MKVLCTSLLILSSMSLFADCSDPEAARHVCAKAAKGHSMEVDGLKIIYLPETLEITALVRAQNEGPALIECLSTYESLYVFDAEEFRQRSVGNYIINSKSCAATSGGSITVTPYSVAK